jgi:hypothetical protein
LDDLFDVLKLIGLCAFGFVAGLALFFKGLRVYRRYRLLADIPETSIRGMSMGLVELHGKATGDETVSSPVTDQPCYFYKVEVKKGHKDRRGELTWQDYATDSGGARFYLQDDTGKVMVDACDAEIDVPQSGQEHLGYGTKIFQGEDGKEIRVNAAGEIITEMSVGGELHRLLGGAASPAQAPVDPWVLRMCESMRAKNEKLMKCVERAASYTQPEGAAAPSLKGEMFLLEEYCILPDFEYEVTGTCAENPQPQGDFDRKIIMKGKNDPTFLISYGNEEIVEGELLRQAKLHVFGGGALSVASLGVLVWMFS